jgi:hypothetical protein
MQFHFPSEEQAKVAKGGVFVAQILTKAKIQQLPQKGLADLAGKLIDEVESTAPGNTLELTLFLDGPGLSTLIQQLEKLVPRPAQPQPAQPPPVAPVAPVS